MVTPPDDTPTRARGAGGRRGLLVVDVTDLREGTGTVRAILALDPIDVAHCAD
ncbi:MAG: hypothetical protein H0V89_06940 [Deltaproteobacteria bacterium]|nr:hypothetical protein [Deltaproteobacteria bacterium]